MTPEESLGLAHILLIVLVFALEIPRLVVEAFADDRIRHLLHKRTGHKTVTILMICTLALTIVLVFLGGRRDESHLHGGGADLSVGTTAGISLYRPLSLVENAIQAQGTLAFGVRAVSAGLLTLFGICWLLMMKTDIRTKLVRSLQAKLIRGLNRKRGLNNDDLEDLVVLGETGAPGHEKDIVILALHAIGTAVSRHHRYKGNKLEHVVKGFRRVIDGSGQWGNDANFVSTVKAIEDCWDAICERKLRGSPDAGALVKGACGIGEISVGRLSDLVPHRCLEIMPDRVEIPFTVGVAAAKGDRALVALAALRRLEVIAARDGTLPRELCGLVAYLDRKGGSMAETCRGLANRMEVPEHAIIDAIRDSRMAFYRIGDFQTADVIAGYLGDGTDSNRSLGKHSEGTLRRRSTVATESSRRARARSWDVVAVSVVALMAIRLYWDRK